jgi:hypothetical protein
MHILRADVVVSFQVLEHVRDSHVSPARLQEAAGLLWGLFAPVNRCCNVLAWLADRVTPAQLYETNAAICGVEPS